MCVCAWRRSAGRVGLLVCCAAYAFAVALALSALLCHQLLLLARGRTGYEARKGKAPPPGAGGGGGGGGTRLGEFLRQTAPLSQGLTWAGVAGWASGAKREDRSD